MSTKNAVQLINPTGSTSGQALVSTGPNTPPGWAGINASGLAFTQTATGAVASTVQKKLAERISVLDFGALGDGVHDDTAAFQAAINTGYCFIPYSATGYKITSPLNATNRDHLTIEGTGYSGAQWGLAFVTPVAGSTLLGQTGASVLDITGSNNVVLRNFNITSLTLTNPSTIGIIGGTSSDNSRIGSPGGSGYVFENVNVSLAYVGASLPIYMNNANLAKFNNVNTVGKYGIALCANNPLAVTPPFTTFGSVITHSDGCVINGGFLLGYGEHAPLYLENSDDLDVVQTYIVYAAASSGKTSYSGDGYAIQINNCTDVRMKIEVDYFPSALLIQGSCVNLDLSGVSFPNANLTSTTAPIIAQFAGTLVKNCRFNILPVGSHTNFHYTCNGGTSSTVTGFINCDFLFDTTASPAVAFLNTATGLAVPYFNIRMNGTADVALGANLTILVNGAASTAAQYRYFMNGVKQGTA